MRRRALPFLLALGLLPVPAARAASPGFEIQGGYFDLTNARRSAEAVFPSPPGGLLLGVAARVEFREHYFLRLGAARMVREGQRVFVADASSPVYRLGSDHPLNLSLVPIYLDIGYRFRTQARLQPYVALGLGVVRYRETSTVAGSDMSTQGTPFSARALAGGTWGRGPLRLGAEFAYSRTPDAIGITGVSAVYGERDLGGLSAVVTITWRPESSAR